MSWEDSDKKCKCEQGRGTVNVYEDTKRGLYIKASPWLNGIYDNWRSTIDLEQVNLNPMKDSKHGYTYHPLQKRVMKNFTKESCGRGGEVKLHKY